MILFKQIKDLKKHVNSLRSKGIKIGFVPTMGALHQGHISLLQKSKKEGNVTICSIFVNPTQFNDKRDFEKYPITTDSDIEKLVAADCDILFLPSVEEMYPDGLKPISELNFGFLAQTLEGEHRPGHFNGMAQVVERLLRITNPHFLYMGQKDYQQQLVVAQLIKMRKLSLQLITCPTLREKDGLAMSSRNVRLDENARNTSIELSKTLQMVKKTIATGTYELAQLQVKAHTQLEKSKAFEIEYFEIRNALTLEPPQSKKDKLVALVAVKIGGVRLIDNILLN